MTRDNITNNVNTLVKGLDRDTAPIKQSEEVVNFVLNGIYDEFDGDAGSIQNEPGNEQCWSLPEGYIPVSKGVNMGNDEILIFSVNRTTGKSGIGVASKGCKYEHLVDTRCLDFDECNMIKGKYRNRRGCARTVYFYDGLNYDKFIDIDDLERFTQTYELADPITGKINLVHYTVKEANENDLWDCNEMKLEPEYLQPCIMDAEHRNSGGQMELGLWKFAVEVLDDDLNSIGFGPISQSVTIYNENFDREKTDSGNWHEMDGGYNLSTQFTAQIGGQLVTNKSVLLHIGNLDTRFKYARVYAVVARTGDGVTTEVVQKGDLIPITSDTTEYLFTGYNLANGDTLGSLSELTTIKDRYVSSRAMEIVDGRLVRYNLTKDITDWSDFQRAVSQINTEFVWKEVAAQSGNLGDPKNPLTTFKRMSEMGDEIIAYGLIFHFKQGFDSPAFHIPGKCKTEFDAQPIYTGTEEVEIAYQFTNIRKVVNLDGTIEIQITYDFDPISLQNPTFEFDFHGTVNETPSGSFEPEGGYMTFIFPSGTIDYSTGNLTVNTNANNVNGDSFVIPINFGGLGNQTPNPISGLVDVDQLLYGEEAWQNENTAQITGDMRGTMGYHECANACYPAIYDCEGKSIWGVDSCGNELINTPIRHHRLPDRNLVPHYDYDTNTIRPLGVLFSNVTYPHPDIIGHSFVRVNRDDFTKTVLAAGFLHSTCSTDERSVVVSMNHNATQDNEFISPDIKVNGRIQNADYAYINHKVGFNTAHQTSSDNIYNEAARKYGGDDLFIGNRIYRGDSIIDINPHKIDIEQNKIVSALSKTVGDKEVVNLLWDNKINYIKTSEVPDRNLFELQYTYLKRDAEVYCNLDSLIYYRTHSCPFFGSSGTFEVFGGDTFINYLDLIRSWLSDVDPSQTNSIWAIIGIVISAVLAVVTYGGSIAVAAIIIAAVGITAVTTASVIAENIEGRYAECTIDPFIKASDAPLFGDGSVLFISELLDTVYSESTVNFDLRHTGEGELTKKFSDFRSGTDYIADLERYYKNKYVTICEDDDKDCSDSQNNDKGYKIRDILLPELYWYNPDYNLLKAFGENNYISLGQNYDYCDDCNDREPNTAIWSAKAFDEELADAMRIFKPLDRITIGTHAGEITNVKYDRNRMLVVTENSSFFITPNARTLQADEDTVYTGIGDFLAIPEQEYIKVDWGYGGNQGRFNAVLSEYGWTYVDQQSGEVFNYTANGLQPLNRGLVNWFKEELPSKLLCLLDEWKIEHTCPDSTTTINGLGIDATFDPRYKRYILHKTDFLPKKFNGEYNTNGMNRAGFYYLPARNTWINVSETGLETFVPLGDPKYFTNESWTISYSYLVQAWISYHSYQPSVMMNNGDTFFSFNFDNQAWKHVDRNFTTYYGDKYDFIVDYTINNLPTDDLHALHWYSRSKVWDVNNKRWIDVANKTFDKMLIYNSNQSTGDQKLIYLDKEVNPHGNRIGWSNTEKDVILTEKDYKVSAIRDLSIDQPSITSNFDELADQFNLSDSERQGYIDCVTFTDNIDYNKSEYNLADMKDKYHLVRLYFTKENTDDIKIILDIINSRTFVSKH